jgi:hypothetical protein
MRAWGLVTIRVSRFSKMSSFIKCLLNEEPRHLFDFLTKDKHEDGLIEALGGLLPEAQSEDYGEQNFANRMKKRNERRDKTNNHL